MSVERVEVPVEEGVQMNSPKPDNAKTVEETMGRPEWLPENFKSVEDFVEAHKELRADHTRKSQELASLKKSSEQEEVPADPADTEKNEEKIAKGEQVLPGVDNDTVKEISDYAWENGELTEEHYASLEKAGYSKDMVDRYMEGQMAQVNQSTEALVQAGGGAEAVQSMFDWAQGSLSETEVENYNAKFAAGGSDAIMAMEHLKARYENSGDAPSGRNVSGANMPSGSTSVYQSVAQVQADMSDPRYETDPAFRQSVADKLGRSNVL